MDTPPYTLVERDDAGRSRRTHIAGANALPLSDYGRKGYLERACVVDFVRKVFLPSGYPHSVSPGYLRYQVLNALQAFFSSVAGLLSSRAVLEGFGVGDATATATHALLLTVLQDVFSRLTTIIAAYSLGSSLVPEAKTYRFLADVLNDAAIMLDTLSPLLRIPGTRVVALCLSAALRALCGIAAGGSKAAITLHFATPVGGTGDVGDLNAKDASKETVLALLGMLLGTIVVPYLSTPWRTYTALLVLVAFHLAINYVGVRGLVLRSLNRQRVGIVWAAYRAPRSPHIPSPAEVSRSERILGHPGAFRDIDGSGRVIGQCTIGSSFADIFCGPLPPHLLELFKGERYLLWYDCRCLHGGASRWGGQTVRGFVRLHVYLKDGYTATDQLRAWIHAAELCRILALPRGGEGTDSRVGDDGEAMESVRAAYRQYVGCYSDFTKGMHGAGWNTAEAALMTGAPKAVLTGIESGLVRAKGDDEEEKKVR